MIDKVEQVILASASPRRVELLGKIVTDFKVMPTNVDEVTVYRRPHKMVMDIAVKKLAPLMGEHNALIISADTAVVHNGQFLGKPKTAKEAHQMLAQLSGKWHAVYTGVALGFTSSSGSKTIKTHYAKSLVKFKNLSQQEIQDYINSKSPFDKAGGYGIQDGIVVEKWIGCYDNIMGLPVKDLRKWLIGVGEPEFVWYNLG